MAIRYCQDRRAADALLPKRAARSAEIGVDHGEHAKQLIEIAAPVRLYCVDLWSFPSTMGSLAAKEATQSLLANEIASGQVQLIQQASTDWLSMVPEESLDWIYLDTMHTYDETVQELEGMRRAVKLGGYVAGHDFTLGRNHPWKAGVVRAVLEAVQDGWMRLEGISDEEFSTWVGRRVK